jgi:uncharacterized membrane protein YdjX (TVP38/TMEM64 family)
MEQLRGEWWAPPIFLLAYVISCQGLPTTLMPVVGGMLFGFWAGTVMNVIGIVGGSCVTFWGVRRWGRTWAQSKWGTRAIHPMLRQPNFWLLLVVRLTGFPPLMVANVLTGLSQMRFKSFVGASALGMLPWCAVMAFFSDVLWEGLLAGGMPGFKRVLWAHAGPLLWMVGFFALLVASAGWFGRKLLSSRAVEET